jgi:hypothetical protein
MMKARVLSVLLLAAASSPVLAQRAGPAQTQQQFDEVAAADQALFSAFFDRCDLDALAKMVTDDFEMFHDKNGYMTRSRNSRTSGRRKTEAGSSHAR